MTPRNPMMRTVPRRAAAIAGGLVLTVAAISSADSPAPSGAAIVLLIVATLMVALLIRQIVPRPSTPKLSAVLHRAEAAEAERDHYREAITDALGELPAGAAAHDALARALEDPYPGRRP